MDKTTIVLPSARAIRHEQLRVEHDSMFLPNHITTNEFMSKLCLVKDFKIIDEDTRVLLLLEASDFQGFSSLQIERNFFTFTKNSSYIFKFFEELSAEMYDIQSLDLADTYAEYEEHISILQELYVRYENLCKEQKLLDRIFLPKIYTFNEEYASGLQSLLLSVDGHLTNFEFELLEKCCKYCKVNIRFKTTAFNHKMQHKFKDMGVVLEKGFEYIILLNTKEIVSKKEMIKNTIITCESFSESLLQVAFIKKKVFDFIQKGYRAESIAVILPEESMAETLRCFDDKSNYNFAMGEAYSKSEIYIKLHATAKAIEQDSCENKARVERVGEELHDILKEIYYKKSTEVDFIEFLHTLKEHFTNKAELKIFTQEIHNFKNIIPAMQEMSIKSLMNLFLQRLASKTLDDVRGGKITVMGVLETRSVSFDAVIIVDFSDKNVPKRSDKDMFLNTQIRQNASLPTMSDRENLQKHYYEILIYSSKEIAISYVNSSESSESRFLKQLEIKQKSLYKELDYANLLFKRVKHKKQEDKDIVREYSFKNIELSSTRLKTFLTCKRKYYYKYIEYINAHDIPRDMPQEYEIGNAVHTALKELYSKQRAYHDIGKLQRDLYRELDKVRGNSELDKYLIAMQKRLLENFCKSEIKRFGEGWSVAYTEKSMKVEFSGITLVGQIDRIDKRANEIEVLDYKTGFYSLYNKNNYTQATDFQLEFYYLLAASLGNVTGCGYYDLKESKIVPEVFLQEKLAVLESNIKDLLNIEEINFELCEDKKNCLFCEYRVICGRE